MQRQPMKDDSEKHLPCCEIYNRNHGENFLQNNSFPVFKIQVYSVTKKELPDKHFPW